MFLDCLSKSLPEVLVQCVFVLAIPVLEINAKGILSLAGDIMDVVISQPEICMQISEAIPVFRPFAVKIDLSILPTLKHGPSTSYSKE